MKFLGQMEIILELFLKHEYLVISHFHYRLPEKNKTCFLPSSSNKKHFSGKLGSIHGYTNLTLMLSGYSYPFGFAMKLKPKDRKGWRKNGPHKLVLFLIL